MAVKLLSNHMNLLVTELRVFKTCNSCHQRFNKHKRFITEDDLPDSELEIIDLDILSETVIELLKNLHSELHFHYEINISNYENKKVFQSHY